VFIVLALFEGTRGLFEGWLKSVAMFALVPLLTVVMGSGALVAISPMVEGLGQYGTDIPLKTAVSILVASIIYLALMLLVFKVAANLTRGWRLGKGHALQPAYAGAPGSGYQQPPLNPPAAAPAAHAQIASDRVRSTVASIENTSSHRVSVLSQAALPAPTPVPQLSFAGPADARSQLRYLHHRVAGATNTQPREMLR